MEKQKTKNILVLDTETTAIFNPLIYNLGYVIAEINENNEIVKTFTRDYLIKEVFNNIKLFNTAYYKNKRPQYLEMLENNEIKLLSYSNAIAQLKRDIKKYNINELYAFNARFDNASMKNTAVQYGYKKDLPILLDMWRGIANPYITKQDNYIRFCEQNNFMSKTGKPRENVETLIAYLHNDINFIEQHMSLSDVFNELEILLSALKLK